MTGGRLHRPKHDEIATDTHRLLQFIGVVAGRGNPKVCRQGALRQTHQALRTEMHTGGTDLGHKFRRRIQ